MSVRAAFPIASSSPDFLPARPVVRQWTKLCRKIPNESTHSKADHPSLSSRRDKDCASDGERATLGTHDMRHSLIIAGGSGTRLWPMSRLDEPKQLLPLYQGRSLLEFSWEYTAELADTGCRWICAGGAIPFPDQQPAAGPGRRSVPRRTPGQRYAPGARLQCRDHSP